MIVVGKIEFGIRGFVESFSISLLLGGMVPREIGSLLDSPASERINSRFQDSIINIC